MTGFNETFALIVKGLKFDSVSVNTEIKSLGILTATV